MTPLSPVSVVIEDQNKKQMIKFSKKTHFEPFLTGLPLFIKQITEGGSITLLGV